MYVLKLIFLIIFLFLGFCLNKFIKCLSQEISVKNQHHEDILGKIIGTISGAEFISGFLIVLFSMSQRFINDSIWQITHSKHYVCFGSRVLNYLDGFLLSVLYLLFIILLSYIFYTKIIRLIKHVKITELCLCVPTYLFFISFLNSINIFGNMFNRWILLLIILVVFIVIYLKVIPYILKKFTNTYH